MSNLLARAEADIQIANLLLSPEGNPTNDEMITDQAAYHVQQAIEKALKYQMEMSGEPYKKIHNIAGLIADVEKTGFPISNDLKAMAYEITNWEAATRYNDDFSVVKKNLIKAMDLYRELEESILSKLEKDIQR